MIREEILLLKVRGFETERNLILLNLENTRFYFVPLSEILDSKIYISSFIVR
jgi:hypothetical protein